MTAQAFSKTVSMTGAAIAFDVKAEFKTPGISNPGYINIYNRSANEIGIAYRTGVTAAIDGDDTKHLGPQGLWRVPYVDTLSLIGPAGSKVELSNDMGVF